MPDARLCELRESGHFGHIEKADGFAAAGPDFVHTQERGRLGMTATVPFGLAEQTEIAAYTDFVTGAAAPLREALGIGSLHVGSAPALAIREDPSRFFNRAGGFGAGEPITVDVVAQVCGFYRRQGVSQGAFMVAPPLQPPYWAVTAD